MIIQNNSKNIYPNSYHSGLNFSGPRLAHQSFEEFEQFAQKTQLTENLKEIFTQKNFLAKGTNHMIFNISDNDTFLLRAPEQVVKFNQFGINPTLTKIDDSLPDNNLGQSIAKLGQNIHAILKQSGTPNGIKNWINIYREMYFPQKYIPEFIEKLKTVSEISQDGYDTLIKEVNLTVDNPNISFDFVNPNNILVDKSQNALNLVDTNDVIWAHKESVYQSPYYSILHSLCDQKNFVKAYNAAKDSQKEEILETAKIIKSKVKESAEKENIRQSPTAFMYSLSSSEIMNFRKFKTLLNPED